jgi:hypothetical protein
MADETGSPDCTRSVSVGTSPSEAAAHQEQWMNDVSPLLDFDLPTLDAELSLDEVFGQYGE